MTGLEVFCSIKVKVFPFEMEITKQSSFLGLCSTATVTTNTRFDVHEQKPEAPEQRVGSRKPLVKIYLLLRQIKKSKDLSMNTTQENFYCGIFKQSPIFLLKYSANLIKNSDLQLSSIHSLLFSVTSWSHFPLVGW